MSDYIAELQSVFLKLHGCDAQYVETVRVVEEFQGETICKVMLKYSILKDIRKQNEGYGWGYVANEEGGRRYFTILELPPVDSPQTAVKAAIMSEIKNAREKKKGR